MIPATNAKFKVNRDGSLYIEPTRSFSLMDLASLIRMAVMHARRMKIKKPTRYSNKWWNL